MTPGDEGFLEKFVEKVREGLEDAANVRQEADKNYLNTFGKPPDKAEKVARETMFWQRPPVVSSRGTRKR